MKLLFETYSFKNDKGNDVAGRRYYVEVAGVKVYLKPIESIGKQLLDKNFKEGE